MIQKLVYRSPVSALSLGQVGYHILKELYNRKVQVAFYPHGNVSLEPFKPDPAFHAWIERSINDRFIKLDRKTPTLAVWHINDSQFKPTDRQWLLSFHETDGPTDHEVNILNQQEHTFFSSSWSVDNFKTYGANNVSFVPLGIDPELVPAMSRLTPANRTEWLIAGKAEPMRKLTTAKIQAWIKKYGGNKAHMLNLCVNNPFIPPEHMNAYYQQTFGGPKPFNVNVLGHMKTNAEINQVYNATDIDLSGYARSEGWNLPAFTATALGKWSVVTNVTAHKDWATKDNSILVENSGLIPAVDGMFFHKGQQFSQGNVYDFKEEQFVAAMEAAEKKAHTVNTEGLKLATQFTYKRTVDEILAKMSA